MPLVYISYLKVYSALINWIFSLQTRMGIGKCGIFRESFCNVSLFFERQYVSIGKKYHCSSAASSKFVALFKALCSDFASFVVWRRWAGSSKNLPTLSQGFSSKA